MLGAGQTGGWECGSRSLRRAGGVVCKQFRSESFAEMRTGQRQTQRSRGPPDQTLEGSCQLRATSRQEGCVPR